MPLFAKKEWELLAPFYISQFFTGLSVIAGAYMFLYFSRDLGLSFTTMSIILFATFFVGTTLFEIPSGAFADIYGRKRAVLLGIGIFVLGAILVPFFRNPALIGLLFFLTGVGSAFRSGADEAWAVDNLYHYRKEKLIQRFYEKSVAFLSLGAIFGPLIAAYLVNFLALKWLFIVDSAMFLLAMLPLIGTREFRHTPKNLPIKHFFNESANVMKRASRVVFKQPLLRMMFFGMSLGALTYSAYPAWQPLFAWSLLPLAGLGVLESLQNLVRTIIAPLSTKVTKYIPHTRVLGYLAAGHFALICLLFFVMPGKWWWAVIVYMGIGILALEMPVFFSLQQKMVPSKIRATSTSFFKLGFSVIGMVGMIIGGMALDWLGPKFGIITMALFSIPQMLIYFSIKEKKSKQRT